MTTNLERRLAEYDPYIEAASDARHQAMIKNFRDHNEFEQTGQIDRLLALYTEDAEFHVYGGVAVNGRETHIKGRQAIRERYEKMWAGYVSVSDDPPSHLDHLMVTDWGLAGVISGENVTRGSVLRSIGFEVDEPEATYRQLQRVAFFREFRGEAVSVMTYFTSAPVISKVEPSA
jgi:hypothetical protein